MRIASLLAATAIAMPVTAAAQSMPGMDMSASQHHAATAAAPKRTAKPPRRAPAHVKPAAAKARAGPSPVPAAQPAEDVAAMPGMKMDGHGGEAAATHGGATAGSATPAATEDHGAMDSASMAGMAQGAKDATTDGAMAGMDMHGMTGGLGSYSAARDASGTSWQPDSSPMDGIHGRRGGWSTMVHGYAALTYDNQGGRRGDTKTFVASMLMGMAQRPLGGGTLTIRAMGSLDPLMGKRGYPLLLATGETANGRTELVDRQHPHDLFMELSASYSHPLSDKLSGFVYFGLPGEPALGPPTFMHRFSGMANPEAPISHHWLDSTHVTFGVLTAGLVYEGFKLEASGFTGREPDQHRYDIERPRFDSWSVRATWNPTPDWSLQVSHGYMKSPEQLDPEVNQRRTTASASYNRPVRWRGADGNWQTTFAWGRNVNRPGRTTDAFLVESALTIRHHTVFGRVENVGKDELFADDPLNPLHGRMFNVTKVSLGYAYTLPVVRHVALDVGGLVSKYALPGALHGTYGSSPTSFMLFTRIKLAD
jgi:hypothetical protein